MIDLIIYSNITYILSSKSKFLDEFKYDNNISFIFIDFESDQKIYKIVDLLYNLENLSENLLDTRIYKNSNNILLLYLNSSRNLDLDDNIYVILLYIVRLIT